MYLPEIFKKFMERHSEIADAYRKVGDLCTEMGPIRPEDPASNSTWDRYWNGLQGGGALPREACTGFRRHERRNNSDRTMSMTIVGFPAMIAAYGWIDELLSVWET